MKQTLSLLALVLCLATGCATVGDVGSFESADATAVLDDEPRIVYADDCCHLNQLGTDLFADHVADRIAEGLAAGLPTKSE